MNVQNFFDLLIKNGIDCFCGVPDSLLKDFCAYVTDNVDEKHHTITANEGNAIGLAAGHYLATGKPALVYMQNSGIGNCVNPLLSLTDEEVYNIPLLMLIGWRGELDKKDEPQHVKQGKVTDKLLDAMGIKYEILSEDFEKAEPVINKAFEYMKETKQPFAFIIRKGLFEKYTLKNKKTSDYELRREDAIETVLTALSYEDIVVSTTGHISREVYETRNRLGQSHKQDFLTVGSMGHSSSIALGIALDKPDRKVYCLDGDGAFLMHMGSLAVNSSKDLNNFKHIIFNNEAHDSVGSQPTTASNANLSQIALNSGYKNAYSVSKKEDLQKVLPEFIQDNCTALLEIKVKCGAREDLGRPKEKPQENKKIFMENLNQVYFVEKNSIDKLSDLVKCQKAERILIFTGKKSFEPIKPIIENQLKGVNITYFNDFSTNPKEEELNSSIEKLGTSYDLVIAAGGGSVIDFAKSYKFYTKISAKLIAIPTTCGTGSESTQFAVLYRNGKKMSLDDKSILPEIAIVDSQFMEKTPKKIKASTAMDAFCQAIESYWAVKSTPESREYAKQAIELCRDNIVNYVNNDDETSAKNMSLASNLAGKAINISRTTASHALSYAITSKYGIPHGYAVALTIKNLMAKNEQVTSETLNDSRGCDFVKDRIKEIKSLLGSENYFDNLFKEIELEVNFEKLGINDIEYIASQVNIERLSNNPYKFSQNELTELLKN